MKGQRQAVAECAQRLAAELPPSMLESLADAVERSAGPVVSATLSVIPQPHYRSLAADFIAAWQTSFPTLSPQTVASALATAGVAAASHRQEQSVELVWTGPDAQGLPLRQTEQALLQLIDSAQERLLVVSYAVYRIPRICEALTQAAGRGVDLRIVIEGSQKHDGLDVYDRLRALGDSVAGRASVYLWPLERRPMDGASRGVLHVKCAVADGRWLFLSSANLTENAFTLNMELGVLIQKEGLAEQVERQFDQLIEMGVLLLV